jgi:actin-related protein
MAKRRLQRGQGAVVVIDNGGGDAKFGFAGENEPRWFV